MPRRRLVDLPALLERCPYPGQCAGIDAAADLWLLVGKRAQTERLHRHDHRRCIEVLPGGWWWHPGDPPVQLHPEPQLYLAARRPPELEWPAAWQRLVVTLLSCRSSPPQMRADSALLLGTLASPVLLDHVDLRPLLPATGARQLRALREVGRRWPVSSEWPESIEGWLGVGHQVSEHYQLMVWGRRPPDGWVSPLLALTDAMGLIDWVAAQGPAQ